MFVLLPFRAKRSWLVACSCADVCLLCLRRCVIILTLKIILVRLLLYISKSLHQSSSNIKHHNATNPNISLNRASIHTKPRIINKRNRNNTEMYRTTEIME